MKQKKFPTELKDINLKDKTHVIFVLVGIAALLLILPLFLWILKIALIVGACYFIYLILKDKKGGKKKNGRKLQIA